jgi:molecular chaperone DnaK
MVSEAEANAAADKERREKIDRKNQADSLVYQAEKQLDELGDKVPADDKSKATQLIKDLKEAVAQENDEQISTLMPELQQLLYTIGSNIYQQAGGDAAGAGFDPNAASGGGAAPGGSASSDGGDDVIDAEFSETK